MQLIPGSVSEFRVIERVAVVSGMLVLGAGIITKLHVFVYIGLAVLVVALVFWYLARRRGNGGSSVEQ